MKKATLCLIIAALLAFAGCGGNKPQAPDTAPFSQAQSASPQSAAEWMTFLTENLPFDDTMTLVPENAAAVYGITDEDGYTGDASLYISTMATPEEAAVFRADSALSTEELTALANARLAQQKESYASYAPGEMPKLDSAVVETVGDFVIVVVCADNAKAAELIRDAS